MHSWEATEHQQPLKEGLADFPGMLVECKSRSAAYCIGYGKKEMVKIPIEIRTKQVRT